MISCTKSNVWFVIDNVAMRGERLELLVNKTENLNSGVSYILLIKNVYYIMLKIRFICYDKKYF